MLCHWKYEQTNCFLQQKIGLQATKCKGARPRLLQSSIEHSVFSKGTSWREAANAKLLGPIHLNVPNPFNRAVSPGDNWHEAANLKLAILEEIPKIELADVCQMI